MSPAGFHRPVTPMMARRCLRSMRALAAVSALLVAPQVAAVDVFPEFEFPDTAVIGGSDAFAGQFPSTVALVSPDATGNSTAWARQFCGGTAVGSRWVLTAAHCVHRDNGRVVEPVQVRIVAGSLDLGVSGAPVNEQLVTNIIPHPLYDHNSFNTLHDVALLEVATDLQTTTVDLFRADPEAVTGATVQVVGWGATVFDNDAAQPREFPFLLQQASLPLVSRDTCNSPESYNGLIEEGQVCAGFANGGVDACVGDSGGPLYISTNNGLQQIGITSFGAGCALPDFYGVYTNVSFYADWIDTFIGSPLVVAENPTDELVPTDESIDESVDDRDELVVAEAEPDTTAPTGDGIIGTGGGSAGGAAGPFSLLALAAMGVWVRRARRLTESLS